MVLLIPWPCRMKQSNWSVGGSLFHFIYIVVAVHCLSLSGYSLTPGDNVIVGCLAVINTIDTLANGLFNPLTFSSTITALWLL